MIRAYRIELLLLGSFDSMHIINTRLVARHDNELHTSVGMLISGFQNMVMVWASQ